MGFIKIQGQIICVFSGCAEYQWGSLCGVRAAVFIVNVDLACGH